MLETYWLVSAGILNTVAATAVTVWLILLIHELVMRWLGNNDRDDDWGD